MAFIVAAGTTAAAAPMGMNKNGVQSVPGGTSNVKLTGWTIRNGYADTVISANHELISSGAATATVRCRLEVSGNLTATEQRSFDVMLNDSPIQTFASTAGSVNIPAKVVTLARGDRLWVRMTGSSFGSFATTVAAGVNSYLYFDLN
ncbi:hypothetical protein [Nocardia sp. NPDC057030]|uniref:hypothetical protein n=1 Tax=unclassified Nocardia TaxID=2637762 RepID=UPI00363742D6